MSVLEVNNVSKSFGGVKANVDISMTVEKGKIFGLIGPRERVKADIKEVGFDKGKYKWRVILREGKNREIRRIFLKYNQKVYNRHRYAFGGFTRKGIDGSKSKRISKEEIMKRLNIS